MIIIIGAGLSGLLTGYRLKKAGIPFKILEARNRVGGRINTVSGTNNTPVEMGATWFNSQHKHLITLLEELEIGCFEQFMDRSVFFQPSSSSPAQSIEYPRQAPSYRISGGSSNLIYSLFQKLDENEISLNQSVKSIIFSENTFEVMAEDTFKADAVVLAIPPKLWAKKILFDPRLPNDLMEVASQTHTWMEDSIKVALTYDQPFWQQENLAATLFSNDGPMTELYDHCNQERSRYALCGFMNPSFKNLSYSERRDSVIKQVKQVYGAKAGAFVEYEECIWSNDENTFESTEDFHYPHQNNGHPIFRQSFLDDKLLISSAEAASDSPGYMDGAVCSANRIAELIANSQKKHSEQYGW